MDRFAAADREAEEPRRREQQLAHLEEDLPAGERSPPDHQIGKVLGEAAAHGEVREGGGGRPSGSGRAGQADVPPLRQAQREVDPDPHQGAGEVPEQGGEQQCDGERAGGLRPDRNGL